MAGDRITLGVDPSTQVIGEAKTVGRAELLESDRIDGARRSGGGSS
jgi:hypothetical protein